MEVASVGGRKPRLMARRVLSEILQPRAEEICHQVWDEIRRAGYEKSLNSGIVLTGGGAILEGLPELAEQIFDLPIRRGLPVGVGGLADHVNNPEFATAVGLVLYAQRNHVGDQVVFDHGILGSARGRAIAVHHDGVVDQQTARAFAASRSLRQQAPREREHEKQGSEHANDCATTR